MRDEDVNSQAEFDDNVGFPAPNTTGYDGEETAQIALRKRLSKSVDDYARQTAEARQRALSSLEQLAAAHRQNEEHAAFIAEQAAECQVILEAPCAYGMHVCLKHTTQAVVERLRARLSKKFGAGWETTEEAARIERIAQQTAKQEEYLRSIVALQREGAAATLRLRKQVRRERGCNTQR